MRITIEVIDAIELPHSDNLIDCTRIQLLGGGTITIRNSSIVNIER